VNATRDTPGLVFTEVLVEALEATLWRVVRPSERVEEGKLYRVDHDPPAHHHFGFVCHPSMLAEVEAHVAALAARGA